MMVVQHEPVFCPSSDRLGKFRRNSLGGGFGDLHYHLLQNPCPHCITADKPTEIDEVSKVEANLNCIDGADNARDMFNAQLIMIGDDGDTLYERLAKWANSVARALVNETGEELLNRVIEDAYARICREAFRPDTNWEAYLAMKLGFKRAEILGRRIDEYRDPLVQCDPWTIVSRFGQTTASNPRDDYYRYLRLESQYLGILRALKKSILTWTTAGTLGSDDLAWGVLKKLVVEILLRETNSVTRVPLALIARRLRKKDKEIRKASDEAFSEFYRILKNDPDMTATEFQSLMPKSHGK